MQLFCKKKKKLLPQDAAFLEFTLTFTERMILLKRLKKVDTYLKIILLDQRISIILMDGLLK